MPSSSNVLQVKGRFGCSNTLINKCFALRDEKGILAVRNARPGNKISAEVTKVIKEFYLSDDNSREMPGMKDFVTVKVNDGKKERLQKRLVYCNLRELFELFKTEFPNFKVGFSKFAEFRPEQCILAGASGTHTVCVCIIHQNVKLMIEGNDFKFSIADKIVKTNTLFAFRS